MAQLGPYQGGMTEVPDTSDWWQVNSPSPTAPQNQQWTAGAPSPGVTGTPPAGQPGAPQQTTSSAAGSPWKEGDDPKKFVDQYIQQTQGRPANDSDYGYWLPKFQAVGGLGTGEYWMHKMTDPSGTGSNQGGGGGGQYGTGSFGERPGNFQAPSGLDMSNDPGYLARMQMGTQAIQGAAAAKGSLLGGGTLKALERYGQDFGSNEYGNVYGRALQGYQTNTGTQRNAMNDYWQRLQGLYQGGQDNTRSTYQKP